MTRRAWRRAGPWLTPALVVVEVAVVWSGLLRLRTAVTVGVACEALLWVTAASRVISGVRQVRAGRAAGLDPWQAAEDGLAQLVPRRLAKVVLFEPRLWACLVRWVLGRHPGTSPGAYGYSRNLRIVFWMIIGLVVLEGAVVDTVLSLVVPGSVWIWIAAGVHLYALAGVIGFLASFATRSHLVRDEALYLRDGILAEVVVPYPAIVDVRVARLANFGRSGFKVNARERSATLAFGDATVALTLDPATPIRVNGRPWPTPIATLSITADDAQGFVEAVRIEQGRGRAPASLSCSIGLDAPGA